MTQRQVESLDRIDKILLGITKEFAVMQKDLLSAVTGENPRQAFPAAVGAAITRTIEKTAKGFADQARWGYESAVDAIMEAVPAPLLVSQVPAESRIAFEQIHHPRTIRNLNLNVNQIWVTTEDFDPAATASGPIDPTGELKLTDEEYENMVRRIVFPSPSPADIVAALRTSNWRDRLESLSQRISDKQIAFDQIVQGYSEGEGITQIRRRLEPLVGGIRSSAQRIARTEGMRIAENTQRKAWEGLGDMMVGAQVLAVLDARTRPEHSTRNGQIYYKAPKAGQKSMAELPDLPDAPNCRCMSTPVLAPPKELESDPAVREAFKSAKGSGKIDPETYNQWFTKSSPASRKRVVGVQRYREVEKMLGGQRQPEWSDFIDEDGGLLSLIELLGETVVERVTRKQKIQEQMAKRAKAIKELRTRGFEWPNG
jgi:SPP1 gp7 family putative phage head morphogenesis protein